MMRQKDSTNYPIQFLMVDDGDHITGLTGLTPTVTISKNGGGFGAAAGAVSELANGVYSWAGNATDRNTLGELMVHVSASGADPVDMKILIVNYDPFTAVGAILADTGTDGVLLANDAITAGKIDNTAGAEIAGAVWAHSARTLTQSAASVASAVAGSTITATRGDTLSAALTNIGALTNYDKIWFTVKSDEADTDAQSLIQIELSDGLKYINGAAAVTAGNGSLTIVDEATGGVTIALHEVEMAKLALGSYHYDIQILRTTGIAVSTLSSGTFIVSADYTKATS